MDKSLITAKQSTTLAMPNKEISKCAGVKGSVHAYWHPHPIQKATFSIVLLYTEQGVLCASGWIQAYGLVSTKLRNKKDKIISSTQSLLIRTGKQFTING